MGFVPKGAEWFLADLVMAITVEGTRNAVVHINTTLVHARSANQAFSRAVKLGRDSEIDYRNPAGKAVRIRFVGLRELNVIHEKLEHGAELQYRERLVKSASAARRLTNPKKALAVFRPMSRSAGPDYAAGEIMAALRSSLRA